MAWPKGKSRKPPAKAERTKFAGPGHGHAIMLAGEINAGRVPLDWSAQIRKLYAEGGCDIEMHALLSQWRGRHSVELFEAWLQREEEFAEIVQYGRLQAKAHWLREGRTSINKPAFNVAAYQMQMFNRYGWAHSAMKASHTIDAGPTLAAILKDIGERTRGFPIKREDESRGNQGAAG